MSEVETVQLKTEPAPRKKSRRLTFSLAALFGVMTAAAVVAKWPWLMLFAAPVIPAALTLVIGAPTWRETWLRYGIVLAAVYLPTVPGFSLECSHCREVWFESFPAIPGFIPAHLGIRSLGFGRLSDWNEFSLGALATSVFIALLYLIAARG